MNLKKILEQHKIWVTSFGEKGVKADLRGANLCGANLCGVNLCDADLRGANLRGANLCNADLCDVNLRGADLRGADLRDAILPESTFIILGEKYFISIVNGDHVHAGCQDYSINEWRKFSKQNIAEMGGKKALRFYPRLLDIIDFYCGKGERPGWLQEENINEHNTD